MYLASKNALYEAKDGSTSMPTSDRDWLNVKEAAEYLNISRVAIYSLMERGLLPYTEIEGIRGRRIQKEDLDALVKERQEKQPGQGKKK